MRETPEKTMQPIENAPPVSQDESTGMRAGNRAFHERKLYDFMAALPVIVWYGLSIANMVPALGHELMRSDASLLDPHFAISILARMGAILFIALATVLLAVRRPPKAKAKGLAPRLSAFGGAFLMVAVVWLPRPSIGVELSLVSLVLIFAGVCFSTLSLLHLGRSFSLMPEARQLVTGGPYGIVRHPLYLGEAVSTLGLMLQYLSPLGVGIVALQLAFQLQRIKNEEEVLSSLFPEYESYRLNTRRLVPGVY